MQDWTLINGWYFHFGKTIARRYRDQSVEEVRFRIHEGIIHKYSQYDNRWSMNFFYAPEDNFNEKIILANINWQFERHILRSYDD